MPSLSEMLTFSVSSCGMVYSGSPISIDVCDLAKSSASCGSLIFRTIGLYRQYTGFSRYFLARFGAFQIDMKYTEAALSNGHTLSVSSVFADFLQLNPFCQPIRFSLLDLRTS